MTVTCYLIVRPGGRDGGSLRLTRRPPRQLKINEFAFQLEIQMPPTFFRRVFKQRLDIPQELADRIPSVVYQLRDNRGRFVQKEKG